MFNLHELLWNHLQWAEKYLIIYVHYWHYFLSRHVSLSNFDVCFVDVFVIHDKIRAFVGLRLYGCIVSVDPRSIVSFTETFLTIGWFKHRGLYLSGASMSLYKRKGPYFGETCWFFPLTRVRSPKLQRIGANIGLYTVQKTAWFNQAMHSNQTSQLLQFSKQVN